MYVSFWSAILTSLLVMIASITGAVLVLKGKKAELAVTEDANHGAEEAKLRGDQRELINTLKGIPASYQELLQQYAASIKQGAETQAALTILQSETNRNKDEISTLRAEFTAMKQNRDALQAEREKLLTQAARVPLMEQQITSAGEQLKDRDRTIRQQTQTIKQQAAQINELSDKLMLLDDKLDTTNILLDAATRGQERAEGALVESAGTVQSLSEKIDAALSKDC